MKTKSTKGFTLIEIIITLAILAVLFLLASGNYRKHISDANETLIIADTGKMSTAIKAELANDKKPLSKDPISRRRLRGATVYSGRQKESGLPNELLYNIENPRKHLNTTLKGQFVATADGEAYYIKRNTSTKPNTGTIVIPPQQPPVCPEAELNKLNGNYKITRGSDYAIYIQESSGAMLKIDLRCLKLDTFVYNIIKLKGVNGTEQLSIRRDPIVQVIEKKGNILTLQDIKGNTGKIDISSAEIFTQNQPLEDKKIQVKLIPDTTKAKIINILEDDFPLQGTIQDLMINAPTIKENVTKLAMISSDDIFRSQTTNGITFYPEGNSYVKNSLVTVYTDDLELLDKLEDYLKQNGKAKIQVKYEQSNKEIYKTLIKLEVLTSDGYKDIKTL
ncbi:type IV pilin protein [Peptoniphilus sp. DNF00840]|uniref:type IV pilin protein n=1 Tax=Peptoniphilus sp. DNF00840 TaxID=1477000 RepID=UPI0007857149|nr:prepilin-type N-terminal cleavage/methylation domain-containing protein [Peptoniphilus sp. DNF00840]KXB70221.1 prepilin-type cleavage/methylation protein [Peptoniphilus sp. DNF00840]